METLDRKITRKDMLKMGLLGSAALMLPFERRVRTQLAVAGRIPEGRLPEPFQVPFPIPPTLKPVRKSASTDYYRITMRANKVPILPGFPKTEIWGYDGITPGPTIKVMKGRKAVVRQINRLPRRHPTLGYESWTSVHLHGSASLPQYDGYADDITYPGEYKDYRYPNTQNARTLWYHDHGVHHTSENAYMGLAGQYHLFDKNERNLPIPKGRYDVPLTIKDAIFGTDGQLIFDDGSSRSGHDSLMGDVVLANGAPWPVMKVERRKYRFRILNASNSRGYDLALSSGEPMTIIGHDGGLAPAPVNVDHFRIGGGERYEVVIDFEKYKIGDKVILQNRGLENNVDFDSTRQVMRFDVAREARDRTNNSVPRVLNPGGYPRDPLKLKESQAAGVHRLELGRSGGEWVINDGTWDPQRVDERCEVDEIDVWEIENKSGGWSHPLHIHLVDFRILDRNGRAPFPWERGPKDTAYVGENETVRVLGQFGPHKGKYMIHCHNLVHEDHDMMAQFEVGTGGPDPVETDPARPISKMRPL